MKWDRLFYILKYVDFSINKTKSDETDETFDSLWKNDYLSNMFNDICNNYFSLIEPLNVDNYE
jgi:hypothetical protein